MLQTVAFQQARNDDFIALYTDAENGLSDTWAKALGVQLDRLIIHRYAADGERHMEALLESGMEICKQAQCDMWIIDSISALLPKAELNKLEKDNMLPLQRKLGQFFRKANVVLPRTTAVVLVGQVYTVPTASVALEEVRGGNSVKHWAHIRLKMRRLGKSEMPAQPQEVISPDGRTLKVAPGWMARVVLEKTRMNEREGQEIILPFFYGRGFSSKHAILAAALGLGLIERHGAYYTYGDKKFKGKEGLIKFFSENPKELDKLAGILEELNKEVKDED